MLYLSASCGTIFGVHRLVARAFVKGYQDNLEVNHKDGHPSNNRYTNLEWVTDFENVQHAIKLGLRDTKGEKNTSAKLTNSKVRKIRELLDFQEYTQREIAEMFNVNQTLISLISRRLIWKHVW